MIRPRQYVLLVVLRLLMGCATAAPEALVPVVLPEAAVARRRALDAFGERAHAALVAGDSAALLFDDVELRALLTPQAASRFSALRVGARPELEPLARAALGGAPYVALCVQGGREWPAGGAAGLRRPGFGFERALLVGAEPSGERMAAWLEGEFLWTTAGIGALSLRRIEAPRRRHADLELAVCELASGWVTPQPVGVSAPANH